MSSLIMPNCSPIGVHIRVLWQILQSVRKEVEEGKRRKKQNFGRLYLKNVWSGVLQIWYVDSPTWPASL